MARAFASRIIVPPARASTWKSPPPSLPRRRFAREEHARPDRRRRAGHSRIPGGRARRRGLLLRRRRNRRTVPGRTRPASYEVVLLDVWLAGIDGMETLARIQEIPFADRPEVVIISGHGTIETAVKATKLGAFDFLEKPLDHRKVTVVLNNAVQQRRLELEMQPAEGIGRRQAPHHRRKRSHESSAPAAGPDGRHQRPRADFRRERHRQGSGRARHSRRQRARRGAVRRSELRRDSRRTDRKRIVRPSQGQLRRRPRRQDRQAAKGGWRDAVSGRSRRHVAEDAGQGAARAR